MLLLCLKRGIKFSSFKLDIEEKYLFKISVFSMNSYDNLKSFWALTEEEFQ
jgi:hypothetical protein